MRTEGEINHLKRGNREPDWEEDDKWLQVIEKKWRNQWELHVRKYDNLNVSRANNLILGQPLKLKIFTLALFIYDVTTREGGGVVGQKMTNDDMTTWEGKG